MVTRGSKYFFGAAAVGYLAALLYGFVTGASAHGGVFEVFEGGAVVDSIVGPLSFGWKGWVGDHVGYTLLMGFAGTMLVLGGFSTAFRDGAPEALAEILGGSADRSTGTVTGADIRIPTPVGLNYWPILGAVAAGAMVIGLAVSPTLFVVGAVAAVIVAIEWTVRVWSEQATTDHERNAEIRDRLMHPIEIPVAAAIAVGIVVFCMSRILLAIPKIGAVYFIIVLAALVFALAIFLASRPHLKRPVLRAVLVIGALAIIGGGIAAAIVGPRESAAPAPSAPAHGATGSIELDGVAVDH